MLTRPLIAACAFAACGAEPLAALPDAGFTPASLACGAMEYRVATRRASGCGSDVRDERNAAVPFDQPVSAGAEVDGALAEFRASCAPTRLVVELAAMTEATCNSGCGGSDGAVRARWTGTLRLPPSAARWRVRFVIDAARTFPRGAESPRGECLVTLPTAWRDAIVVDAEHLEREVVVPAGAATLGVDCETQPFAQTGCYGANDEQAQRFAQERRLDASLTMRVDARPYSR